MLLPRPPWCSGGIERLVDEIATRLQKDFDIVVYCTGNKPGEYDQRGVHVRVFKGYSEVYSLSPSMHRTLKKAKCDLVHAHDFQSFIPLAASMAKRGRKLVFNPHFHGVGSTPIYHVLRKIYDPLVGNFLFKKADLLVCFSKTEKHFVCNRFGVPSSKVKVIYNGVKIREIKNAKPYNLREKIVLYAGRLEKYKNVQMIIESLQYLSEEYRLYIVGKGSYEDSLRMIVKKLDLKDRVEFLGYLTDRYMYRWLKTCSVLVQLSQIESGISLTCLEALAAKKPVIVNESLSGLKETVDLFNEGVYPFNTERSSVRELATLIESAGSARVDADLSNFSWDTTARKYRDLYVKLLNGKLHLNSYQPSLHKSFDPGQPVVVNNNFLV